LTSPKLIDPDHIARGMHGDRATSVPFDNGHGAHYQVPVRRMFKSKLHRATVTQADLAYEGSVTIDGNLLEAADILPHEEVQVWNVTRGTRLTTYAMRGEAGSGVVCINGAAAHLVAPGDQVIIATFTDLDEAEARRHRPRVVLLDEKNRIRQKDAVEIAGPARRA
jgi:aspartate 1-decarboxylase